MRQQPSLRFRPRQFADLVGQQKVTKQLTNYFRKNDTMPMASLFHGPAGTGKTSTARLCALSLECEHGAFGRPCRDCYLSYTQPAKGISREFVIDVTEISCAELKTENIRQLLKGADFAPQNGARYRQYILDEVHGLHPRAQDLLLKYLEDSPESTKYYLCTSELTNIKTTLFSRCVAQEFRPLKADEIRELVDVVLSRLKSDLEPSLLVEILEEREIFLPRSIVQAVTKYDSGASPEDAVMIPLSMTETLRICRAVHKGDWARVSPAIGELTAQQARHLRANVAKYLKTILVEEQSGDVRGKASKGIARLTQIYSMDDTVAVAAVVAGLHDVTTIFNTR